MLSRATIRNLLGDVVDARPAAGKHVDGLFTEVKELKLAYLDDIGQFDIEQEDIAFSYDEPVNKLLDKLSKQEHRFVLHGMIVKTLTRETASYLMNKKRDEAKLGNPLQHPVSCYDPSSGLSTITILDRLETEDLRQLEARDKRRAANAVVHSRDLWTRVAAAIVGKTKVRKKKKS